MRNRVALIINMLTQYILRDDCTGKDLTIGNGTSSGQMSNIF